MRPTAGKRFAYERAGQKFNSFSQQVTKMVTDGESIDAAKQLLYRRGGDELSPSSSRRGRVTSRSATGSGRPTSHRKWTKGSGKALWGIDPDSLQGQDAGLPPRRARSARRISPTTLGRSRPSTMRSVCCLEKLEASGELDNTLVVVSGDHGAPGFPHGKCNLYDAGTSVALAVRWPGHGKPGRVVDDFVNLADLAPTFLEAAGSPVPEVMTGKSLVNVLESQRQRAGRPITHARLHRPRAPRCRGPAGRGRLPAAGDPDGGASLHHQFPSRPVSDGRPVPDPWRSGTGSRQARE